VRDEHAGFTTTLARCQGGHLGRGRAQVHVLLRVRDGPHKAIGAAGVRQPVCEVRGAPAEVDGLARAEAAGSVEGLARRGKLETLLRRAGLSSRTALLPGAQRCTWVVGACLTLKFRSGFFASAANGDGYSGRVIARAAQSCCHAPSQQAQLIARPTPCAVAERLAADRSPAADAGSLRAWRDQRRCARRWKVGRRGPEPGAGNRGLSARAGFCACCSADLGQALASAAQRTNFGRSCCQAGLGVQHASSHSLCARSARSQASACAPVLTKFTTFFLDRS